MRGRLDEAFPVGTRQTIESRDGSVLVKTICKPTTHGPARVPLLQTNNDPCARVSCMLTSGISSFFIEKYYNKADTRAKGNHGPGSCVERGDSGCAGQSRSSPDPLPGREGAKRLCHTV